jgi:Uma2 family endonuclease
MATVHLKLGPADHGRPLSLDDFESAEYEPGYKYEIIDGRLYVVPEASLTEHRLEKWLTRKLERYSEDHPEVINFVAEKARVFVPGRPAATVPEPDIACYHAFPEQTGMEEVAWDDVSPTLVAEVLVEGSPEKDLERNLELYFDVPSVREYWVLDGRENPNEPTLIQHRRYGKRWVVRSYPYGSTFTTRLLPAFSLLIDPRK